MANTSTFIQGSKALTTTAARLSATKGTLVREVVIELFSTADKVRMGTSALTTSLGIQILPATLGAQYTLSAENAAERGTHGIGSGQARIDLYDVWVVAATTTPTVTWLAIT